VPSGCLLGQVLYPTYRPSALLDRVSLVRVGGECLKIRSDISVIARSALKSADFSKEMSAGAAERGCSKQARAFVFGELGLTCLRSLHMTVLQSEQKPVCVVWKLRKYTIIYLNREIGASPRFLVWS